MYHEDDQSSEGILGSSDDELFDGLSEAVEHHIFEQEKATRYPSADLHAPHWQRPFYPDLHAGYQDRPLHPGRNVNVRYRSVPPKPNIGMRPVYQNQNGWRKDRSQFDDIARSDTLQGRSGSVLNVPPGYYRETRKAAPPTKGHDHRLSFEDSYLRMTPPPQPPVCLSTPRADRMPQGRQPRERLRNIPEPYDRARNFPQRTRIRREYSPPRAPRPVFYQGPRYPVSRTMPMNPMSEKGFKDATGRPYPTRPQIEYRDQDPDTGRRSPRCNRPYGEADTPAYQGHTNMPRDAFSRPSADFESSEDSHNNEPPKNPLPKPIAFKIKPATQPPLKQHHPLDPFFSPCAPKADTRAESPGKWSHDKFEQAVQEDSIAADTVTVDTQPSQTQTNEVEENEKEASSIDVDEQTKEESQKNENGQHDTKDMKHKKRNKKGKSKEKKTELLGDKDQPMSEGEVEAMQSAETPTDSAAAALESAEADTVYEEEIVEEIIEEDVTSVDEETEPARIPFIDVEDDEELLGLRLNALTSALAADSKANDSSPEEPTSYLTIRAKPSSKKSSKSKAKGRKKSIKSSLKRLSAGTRKSVKKTKKDKVRKADSARISFWDKYSDLTRYQSSERNRPKRRARDSKPDATELTLFGEIIKNKTKSTPEALRYIRSLPDGSKKTEMFLKLMKADFPAPRKGSSKLADKEPIQVLDVAVDMFEDNYDEIEMELEGDDDAELCPPGTSEQPIVLPDDGRTGSPMRSGDSMAISDSRQAVTECLNPSIPSLGFPPATPDQEAIWSMLEHSSLIETDSPEIKKSPPSEDDNGLPAARNSRNTSDDINESDLSLLRATLLKQLEKKVPSTSAEDGETLESFKEPEPATVPNLPHNTAFLPSSFPYQPPTMQTQNSVTVTRITHSAEKVTTPATHKEPEDNSKSVTTAVELQSSVASPSVSTFPDPPQMSSTPFQLESGNSVSQPGQTPVLAKKKRRRRNRRVKKKVAGVSENAEMQVAIKPMEVKKAVIQGDTQQATSLPPEGEPVVDLAAGVQEQTLPVMPKVPPQLSLPPASTLPQQSKSVKVSQSKVLFKTSTTLIKATSVAQKRPSPVAEPAAVKRKVRALQFPAPNVSSVIPLPRHRPVVINLQPSSDEEEETSSSTNRAPGVKNLQDIQSSMLDSLIEQVRQQTSKKVLTQKGPNTRHAPSPRTDPENNASNDEATWPFAVASPKLSPAGTRAGNVRSASLERRSTAAIPPRAGVSKAITRPLTFVNAKAGRESKLKIEEDLKESKVKFVKLKQLISKDEVRSKKITKMKETKQAELKMVQNELKELVLRVAAIKGKATICESIVAKYRFQEIKLKERIQKRKKFKLKLENQIKQKMENQIKYQMIQSKNAPVSKTALGQKTQPVAHDLRVSPLKEQNRAKLELEKQRLLAVEQKLAAEIKGMKKHDGSTGAVVGKRRVSLSKEVQSHLDRYKKTKKTNKPSSHDLSLSKIAISSLSPVRNPKLKEAKSTPERQASPLRKPQQLETNEKKAPQKSVKSSLATEAGRNTVKAVQIAEKKVEDKGTDKVPVPQASDTKDSKDTDEEAIRKLQQSLQESMSDVGTLLSELKKEAIMPSRHCKKVWEQTYTDRFKTWKIDVGGIFQIPKEENSAKRMEGFQPYTSPLRLFRSYRLSPFLRTKEKIMIKSLTLSHKINPEIMLCRYDLTGTCNDPNCKAQHLKDYELSRSELALDLVGYCPALLGKDIGNDMKYEDLVQLANSACERFCGLGNKKTAMPIDDLAILIASKVNSALGNKAPFTTVFKPRTLRPQQVLRAVTQSSVLPLEVPEHQDAVLGEAALVEEEALDPDRRVEGEERYFLEKDAKSLQWIERAVKQNPNDVQLWLQLANRKMLYGSKDKKNNLELALHTMCLALEDNPYVGELWAQYLGLLKKRTGTESDQDLNEMLSQAIELVPLSRQMWNQTLSWECGYERRVSLYDHLISNLLKNVENTARGESNTDLTHETTSRWLLQVVLQRTQLHLLSRGVPYALQVLEVTVKDFSQQCRNVSGYMSSPGTQRCLSARDLCNLWLAYINLKYFGCLPAHFLCDSSALENAGHHLGVVVIPNTDVTLQLPSGKKSSDVPYLNIRTDINIAIKECTTSVPASCLALLLARLHLEVACEGWDDAVKTCQTLRLDLAESLQSENLNLLPWAEDELRVYLADVDLTWADVLARKGELLEATQVFDDEVTDRPHDARLCYEGAVFQLSHEAEDVEAALLYFETCASAFLEIETDTLDAAELQSLFRYLLRLPVPLNEVFPEFRSGLGWDQVRKQKTHLWLIYCTLLSLSQEPVMKILQAYENALIDVGDEKNRQEIWIRYLAYRQSLAPTAPPTLQTKAVVHKARKTWLRNFASVVRRCLQISPTVVASDRVMTPSMKYADHSFHNKVVDIFLSCFHTRAQISAAYSQLVDFMPYNIPLLLRASRHFLTFGDHASVISILWRATSTVSCQNRAVWKISIAAHYARGKVSKSVRLCRRALEALPYCRELWTDYLRLLCAHGKAEELEAEKKRCHVFLQLEPDTLLQPLTMMLSRGNDPFSCILVDPTGSNRQDNNTAA